MNMLDDIVFETPLHDDLCSFTFCLGLHIEPKALQLLPQTAQV